MKITRKGFTLVELLIVVAILGALSAAMAMSSGGAVATAKASTIITNLQTIKTAALVFYTDNMDSGDATFTYESFRVVSDDYLDETTRKAMGNLVDAAKAGGRYTLHITQIGSNTDKKTQWYVGYALNSDESDSELVREKLKARADAVGLYGGTAKPTKTTDGKYTYTFTKLSAAPTAIKDTDTAVWMRVR